MSSGAPAQSFNEIQQLPVAAKTVDLEPHGREPVFDIGSRVYAHARASVTVILPPVGNARSAPFSASVIS
jgi:hypothetical protein